MRPVCPSTRCAASTKCASTSPMRASTHCSIGWPRGIERCSSARTAGTPTAARKRAAWWPTSTAAALLLCSSRTCASPLSRSWRAPWRLDESRDHEEQLLHRERLGKRRRHPLRLERGGLGRYGAHEHDGDVAKLGVGLHRGHHLPAVLVRQEQV